jgi:glycosyltransferase involved in cell wall biosynthesis
VNARIPTEKAHGIQLAKMCEALLQAGADLEIVVPARGKRLDVAGFYKLRAPVVLRRLPALPFYNWGALGFYLSSFSFMFSYLIYFWWKRLRGESFLIYTSDIDQFSFSFIPLLGVTYFAEIHEAKKWRPAFAWFFKFISGAIAINGFIKNELVRIYGLNPERVIVCPNGIDLAMFTGNLSIGEARLKLGLPQGRKIALYLGQFYDWKGLEILAETSKRLPEGTDFYLVGGSSKVLFELTGKKELPKNLICVDLRPYEEMPIWLSAANVLVLLGTKKNDYSYYSTSPMKLFEYMAARRPIVAAETPAVSQVVTGREVWFYEPDNAGTLADKISYIIKNPDETKSHVESAFNAVKRYEWKERVKSVLGLIRKYGQ